MEREGCAAYKAKVEPFRKARLITGKLGDRTARSRFKCPRAYVEATTEAMFYWERAAFFREVGEELALL